MRIRCVPILVCLAIFLAGCASKGPEMATPDRSGPKKTEVAPTSGLEIALRALSAGSSVYVEIKNNTPRAVRVSPFYLGVIKDNQPPPVVFNPGDHRSEFPVVTLQSGAQAAGYVHFDGQGDLRGQKLVFNSPDHEPVMTIIKGSDGL